MTVIKAVVDTLIVFCFGVMLWCLVTFLWSELDPYGDSESVKKRARVANIGYWALITLVSISCLLAWI